ncbi:MAG: BTAD domain-containing putative transcriptional regulator [Anaerolineae bacterium]
MPVLSINLLGSFAATLDEQPLTGFESNKGRMLLAYLAMSPQRAFSRDFLADFLWPGHPAEKARHNLRQTLSNLRRVLRDRQTDPPFLLASRDAIQLNPRSDYRLDVADFLARLDASDSVDQPDWPTACPDCATRLSQAAELYQGDFLTGFTTDSLPFEEWASLQRQWLHRLAIDALYHLSCYHLRRRHYPRARHYAQQQLALEPWREEAHRQLMETLARSGQRSAAVRQYQHCRRILADELGVSPSPETEALYRRLLSAPPAAPHNLPLPLPPLVGRAELSQRISDRLADPHCRLLTLTGPGGIGKTTLALHVLQEHLPDFLHGAFFVPLAMVQQPHHLPTAIAQALRAPARPDADPQTQLFDYLHQRSLLLALDNVEQLLTPAAKADAAAFLIDLLSHAPQVKLLITSRERLALRAEWVIEVQGLAYPANPTGEAAHTLGQFEAVQLFVRRARQVSGWFDPSAQTLPLVAHICALLQGIPLGIELAAGWAGDYPPADIAANIQADLDFLTCTLVDTPDRHRSLRAVFEHSWQLLSPAEQSVLRRLAVCQDPFEPDAAEAIAGATARQLALLAHKSLLQPASSQRHELHPLLKQYLLEKLAAAPDEAEQTRARHGHFFADFLQQREQGLKASRQQAVIAEIEAVVDDVRAAWQWALDTANLPAIEQALSSLYLFYWAKNWLHEGQLAFEQAEELVLRQTAPAGSLLLAKICTRRAEFLAWLAQYNQAETCLARSVEICRREAAPAELYLALELWGRIKYWQGDYGEARRFYEASLAICRETQNQGGTAQVLNALANITREESADYQRARQFYAESLSIARQIDDQFGVAKVLVNQGTVADTPAEARELFRQSLDIYRQIDYQYGQSMVLNYWGEAEFLAGDYAKAEALISESLAISCETGNHLTLAGSLRRLGDVATDAGNYRQAAAHYHEALRLAADIKAAPLALEILTSIGRWYGQTGRPEQGAMLLAFVLHYPGCGQKTKERATSLLGEAKAALPVAVLTHVETLGRGETLEQIIAEVLGDDVFSGIR